MIDVVVRLNSFLRVAIGSSEVTLSLKDNATLVDLVYAMSREYGEDVKKNLIDSKTGNVKILFSVNRKKAVKEEILKSGDIVALFPPLSGG